jgi:cwf18 pre-mRNA splicing factor
MTPESQVSQAVTSSSSVLAAPMGKHNKKINWDLKRGIQSKLDKLEKRTQKAIVSLLKERLEQDAAETGDGNGDLD